MDDTFQMQNIINNLIDVFGKTDFTIHWCDGSASFMDKLPGLHKGSVNTFLLVTNSELQEKVEAIIVYELEKNLNVNVYNTHILRKGNYVHVRSFKYQSAAAMLEDAKSASRSLLAIPV